MQLTTGRDHSCGIAVGTGFAYCWGRNDPAGITVPPGATTGGDASTVAFVQISSGYYHTCGIVSGGSRLVQCWGRDTDADVSAIYYVFSNVLLILLILKFKYYELYCGSIEFIKSLKIIFKIFFHVCALICFDAIRNKFNPVHTKNN